jgi:hypothetical protein
MKKLFTLLCLFCISTSLARAQQFDRDIYIKQAAEGDITALTSSTEEELQNMFSNLNLITDLQQIANDANQVAGINIVGEYNIAEITQSGMDNFGIININGSDNHSHLTQTGFDLLSVINIQGYSNSLEVGQIGNDLQNYVEISGSGLDFNIEQNQGGATISQFGVGANPLIIERTGNVIPIIIRNN